MGGTLPTGSYKFTTYVTYNTTNKAMGVEASLTIGAPVKQLDYSINTGKDWRVTKLANGYYSIINTFSGQALTLADASAPPEHTAIVQYGYGGIDAQQWNIVYQGYGVYRIASKVNLYMGANVDPYSTATGTSIKLQTYPTANAGAGYFLISPVEVTYQDQAATNFFRRTSGITATDGALSFPLSDGRVFWSSGDSHYNDYANGNVNCLFNRRSVSWVQPSTTNWDWTQVTTLPGSTTSGLYIAPGSTFSWPASGFQVGTTAYIYLLPNGSSSQAYLARVNTTNLTVAGYTQLTNLSGTSFGNGFVKETDGFIYAFGYRPIPPYNIGADLLVARFPQSNPTAAWTFWNGSTWVNNATQAISIAQLASNSFGVCKINNKYVITCSQFSLACDNGSEIYAYSSISSSPTSFYNPKKVIYRIPDRLDGHIPFFYLAMPHPEFNVNNELLVVYSVNGYNPCVTTCINGKMNPDVTYRPRAIRVPFKIIDPAL